jgi:hypothetical protein
MEDNDMFRGDLITMLVSVRCFSHNCRNVQGVLRSQEHRFEYGWSRFLRLTVRKSIALTKTSWNECCRQRQTDLLPDCSSIERYLRSVSFGKESCKALT